MQDTAKYLIHADITTDGVVERSDVVGAVFGQTEGLLGDELDLRALQEASKVGRIDVEIDSERGQSFGELTIASGLDRVETAILAAALETIDRVGPCRANLEVRRLEDVRAAKRRAIVERATDLLSEFDDEVMSSTELVAAVRRAIRVEDITEYEGYPAGPRVSDSDAIIVVEGRADVLQLLKYGIKNAVAVEGTDVPDAVADLTRDRTVTAFLDGDRGGDLILKELQQVGNVDYVAFAPEGRSVEDLSRDEVMAALREKVRADTVADATAPHETVAATDGSARPAPPGATDEPESPSPPEQSDAGASADGTAADTGPEPGAETGGSESGITGTVEAADAEAGATAAEDAADETTVGAGKSTGDSPPSADVAEAAPETEGDIPAADEPAAESDEAAETDRPSEPETLAGHVKAVVDGETGEAVLLDCEFDVITTVAADGVFDAIADADRVPTAVVVDGEVSQRVLDIAAQRGVEQIVGRTEGQFVKQPTSVRVRTADQF